MNKTYSNQGVAKKNRSKVQSPENFLEVLRDLGKSTIQEASSQAKSVFSQDIPESLGLTSSGVLNPNEPLTITELNRMEKNSQKTSESEFSYRLFEIRQTERNRLLQEESQAKKQIENIRGEIASLAKSMGELAQEIQIATMQTPTNPGIYHKNFYSHLSSIIRSLKQRVDSSKHWLSANNSRASKRNFYWSQVGKSGTKFMLSSERYMVTSTG